MAALAVLRGWRFRQRAFIRGHREQIQLCCPGDPMIAGVCESDITAQCRCRHDPLTINSLSPGKRAAPSAADIPCMLYLLCAQIEDQQVFYVETICFNVDMEVYGGPHMSKRILTGVALLSLCTFTGACKKKVAAVLPPTPAAPSTSASVTPSRPAAAPPATPAPVASTTPSRMPDAATRARIQELLDRIQDAHFDYDKHTLRPDAEEALRKDAQTLAEIIQQYPDFKLTVEGHCDERGSEEYNLALGDARAKQAKEYLAVLGLPANQLLTVSYGKDKPECTEHDEACWQRNRRAHMTQAQ
jgi:peptidoglycan-associated lipoprotein